MYAYSLQGLIKKATNKHRSIKLDIIFPDVYRCHHKHKQNEAHWGPSCTCVSLNELLQRDGHLLLHSAGVVDMTRDVEQFSSRVSLSAEACKPGSSTTTDGRRHRHRLHVSNSRWATEDTFKKNM